MHAIGAHYTYAQVPYDAWSESLFGHPISSLLGLERNHFDRLVHFLYGLLITPTAIELVDTRVTQRGGWRYLVTFTFMASHAAIYEIIEWRSEEHTSELQSLMRTSYDVFCVKKQ